MSRRILVEIACKNRFAGGLSAVSPPQKQVGFRTQVGEPLPAFSRDHEFLDTTCLGLA